jgi:hypothetical protein
MPGFCRNVKAWMRVYLTIPRRSLFGGHTPSLNLVFPALVLILCEEFR